MSENNTIMNNEDYNEFLCDYTNEINNSNKNKIKNKGKTHVKKEKEKENENFLIPTMENYKETTKNNYNIHQLKSIAKIYKLKISGNKKELIERIFEFLHFSFYIIKIQKVFRGFLSKKLIDAYGPAFKNRKLCINETDFITMDDLKEIPYYNFFSYKDDDNFIYGFDIVSLYNLISKDTARISKGKIQNPYNRNIISEKIIQKIVSIIKINRIFKKPLNLSLNNEPVENMSNQKIIELRALALFQTIDSLGNYSNPQWFLSLTRNQLVKFLRELIDIWNFRAQLTSETKRSICPPYGEPFYNLSIAYLFTESDINNVRKVIIECLEKLVNNGVNNDMKTLGAYYILGALTLVNENAATALPWLYQSLIYD